MTTYPQRAFLLDTDEEGNAIVWSAVTHDNRFIGVFATEAEAKSATYDDVPPFVTPEVIEPPLASGQRQDQNTETER